MKEVKKSRSVRIKSFLLDQVIPVYSSETQRVLRAIRKVVCVSIAPPRHSSAGDKGV